jgi:hypothetical protein
MTLKRIITISLVSSWTAMAGIILLGLLQRPTTLSPFGGVNDQPQVAVDPGQANPAPTTNQPPASTPTTTPTTSPTPNSPAPTTSIRSFAASPAAISYNTSATLQWSALNASSCSVSPLFGTVGTSGSRNTGNLIRTTTFSLTCQGNGTATRQTTVSVGAPPANCGQPGGTCTTAQVASHNSSTDCWVIYGGYYHIVTSFVPQHLGGTAVFNSSTCGHDITSYLDGSNTTAGQHHKHSTAAYSTLYSYRLGPVQ